MTGQWWARPQGYQDSCYTLLLSYYLNLMTDAEQELAYISEMGRLNYRAQGHNAVWQPQSGTRVSVHRLSASD